MGAAQSHVEASDFGALYAALPDDAKAKIDTLANKDSTALASPHPKAPPAYPPTPRGVVVMLDTAAAAAALHAVPRLQRRQYELVPKHMDELTFFVNFFSHATAIVAEAAPAQLPLNGAVWKGEADGGAGELAFSSMWRSLAEEHRVALGALVEPTCDALLALNPASPPAFPAIALGMRCFVDVRWCTSALASVKGLQRRRDALVPKKLTERDFWLNFASHLTALVGEP